jgi:IPT/TIG domain
VQGFVVAKRPSRTRAPLQARAARTRKPEPTQASNPAEDWTAPAFLPPEQLHDLVAAAGNAARGERERAVFQGVVRRAVDDLVELEQLYAEVPGVLRDDPDAVAHFARLLSGLGGRDLDPRAIRAASRHPLALKPAPDGDVGMPCRPTLAVDPGVVYAIGLAAERVWGAEREQFARSLDQVAGLWDTTRPLEALLGAIEPPAEGGPDRLRRVLRRFARDTGGAEPPPVMAYAAAEAGIGSDAFGLGSDLVPFGEPPQFWPPPDDPRVPPDLCALVPDLCKGMVYGGLSRLQYVPVAAYATGITGIQPSSACIGRWVTIQGSGFGASQPPDVDVVIGTSVASVVSWSDTAIVIIVPAGAKSGCVGFVNRTLENQRLNAMIENQDSLAQVAQGLHCLGVYQTGGWSKIPIGPSKVPCTGTNFLHVGLPMVSYFLANGVTALDVTPGTAVQLSWGVTNGSGARIRRIGTNGPPVNQAVPTAGTLPLGPFAGSSTVTATYELEAVGTCGVSRSLVTVKLAQPPSVGVVAIEVVQSIQRVTNSVRLAAGKRAIARVWVDSGITNGFNNGVGAGQVPVTGRLSILPAAGGPPVESPPILNSPATINARPAAAFDRDLFSHSLNFELPAGHLSGSRRLNVTVFVPGREGDPGYTASGSTTVTFQPRPTQEILPFLLTDSRLGGATNAGQFATSLAGARTRLPIATTGFTVHPALPAATQSIEDLTTQFGWGLLVTRLATIVFIFPSQPVGGIRSAIVPNNGAYALNGIALARFGLTAPAMVSRATLGATYAHEMCHLAAVDHAPCGSPGPPIDPRLPGRTEDAGMDVPARTVVPAARGELMSLCGGELRWPSIANYDGIMFTAFPIN